MGRFAWKRLILPLRDARGVASIELAFALPVIITCLIGAFELGGILMTEMLMEGAVRDASRAGLTGWCSSGLPRETYIRDIIDSRTLNMIDMSKATITTLVYDSFDDVGKPEPLTKDVDGNGAWDPGDEYEDINGNGQWDADMGLAGLGGEQDVVLYTLSYDYPSLTGLLSPLFGPNGKIHLTATTVVRNEPFGAGCKSGSSTS